MGQFPAVKAVGDTAFSVVFGEIQDRQVNALVMALKAELSRLDIPGLLETIPSFCALLVQYDPLVTSRTDVEQVVRSLLDGLKPQSSAGQKWQIPVCYRADLGEDLPEVAQRSGLSIEEVIGLHADTEYFVYMLGFLPGFAYMGDVPEQLRFPRRAVPRTRLPPGSVAVAEAMTTVYPWASPGGWHLIGRTPVTLFDPIKPRPVLFGPGDSVTFKAIPYDEYVALTASIESGQFDHETLQVST